MNQIPFFVKTFGTYFKTDRQGLIINPCRKENIESRFLNVLAFIQQKYVAELGENLHSLYVRGSLPRGLFVEGLSDIDTFALVKAPNIKWSHPSWKVDLEKKLNKEFGKYYHLDCYLNSYSSSFSRDFPNLAMVLKTQSLLLYGTAILEELPNYRPNKEMAIHYKWLAEDLNNFKTRKQPNSMDFRIIIKSIIRVAFEVVLLRTAKFTPDLPLCCESYLRYYPQFQTTLRHFLDVFLHPKLANQTTIHQIHVFGTILQDQIQDEFFGIGKK